METQQAALTAHRHIEIELEHFTMFVAPGSDDTQSTLYVADQMRKALALLPQPAGSISCGISHDGERQFRYQASRGRLVETSSTAANRKVYRYWYYTGKGGTDSVAFRSRDHAYAWQQANHQPWMETPNVTI